MSNVIELHAHKGEARVDTRILAGELGNQPESVIKLVDDYRADFEEFGVVRFEIGKPPKGSKGGRPERYALLNEDQCYLLLTYARNTPEARRLKVKLVKAFRQFREGKQVEADYLPFYHELHDEVKALAERAHANGSDTPERFFHININRLVNRAFGLESGQRPQLSAEMRARITAANLLARDALRSAARRNLSHTEAHQEAKQAVEAFARVGAYLGRAA